MPPATTTTKNLAPISSDDNGQAKHVGRFHSGNTGLSDSPELNFLNRNHTYPINASQASSASSLLRRFVGRFLGKYFDEELEFQANLVRFLNQVGKSEDSRISRLDDEHRSSIHSLEDKVNKLVNGVRAELEQKIAALDVAAEQQAAQINTLESVSRGLERIVAGLGRVEPLPNDVASAEQTNSALDYSYVLLENRYRGSIDEIKQRLEPYPELFKQSPLAGAGLPVLEVGSGRGELQTLFAEEGVSAYGCELDQAMVEHCKELDIDVRAENGLEHLEKLADASLAGVVAIQVIEHLSKEQLSSFLQLCRRKVATGGRVVFETINTESVVALTQNYFRDPTHVWPLHPETMRFMMELSGLKVLDVQKRSPFSSKAVLQQLKIEPYMTPRWAATIELLNHNIKQLNDTLYGYQDYCIVAEVV